MDPQVSNLFLSSFLSLLWSTYVCVLTSFSSNTDRLFPSDRQDGTSNLYSCLSKVSDPKARPLLLFQIKVLEEGISVVYLGSYCYHPSGQGRQGITIDGSSKSAWLERGRNGFPKKEGCCKGKNTSYPQFHPLVSHSHFFPYIHNSEMPLPNLMQRSQPQVKMFSKISFPLILWHREQV